MIPSLPKVEKDGAYTRHTTPQNKVGEYFCDNQTNQLFVYLRADEAIQKGAPVASRGVTSLTTGLLAVAAEDKKLKFGSAVNLDTSFARVPNQPLFAQYMLVGVVGDSLSGILYEHSTREASVSWDTDNRLPSEALAADADLDFSVPWLCVEATMTLDVVIGIAQRAIAEGQYFWALVEGHGKTKVNAAVAANAPIRVAADAEGDDPETGTTLAQPPYAYSMRAQATADALVDVLAACPGRIGILELRKAPFQSSYTHPTV